MSLFGTSPDAGTADHSQTRSIFGADLTTASNSATSLFNEEGNSESPWSMPTPKKSARQNLVKNLLPATQVPESYVDAYEIILDAGERQGPGISRNAVRSLLSSSGISAADQSKILGFVQSAGEDESKGMGRPEFNVLLALIGLAQEGDDVTLDGVDERRKKLPQPKLEYINKLRLQAAQPPPTPTSEQSSSPSTIRQPRKARQDSFGGDPAVDPWASPAAKQLPPPSTAAHTLRPTPEDFTKNGVNGIGRTTSTFTTGNQEQSTTTVVTTSSQSVGNGDGDGWSSFNGGNASGFGGQNSIERGFGGGDEQSDRSGDNPQTSISAGVVVPPGTGEIVMVTMLPDKEGMFLFQHRNYEVKTIRKGSSVVRRYSDFVWLLDCLQKRYPFRRLPLLPPKRVSGKNTLHPQMGDC